MLDILYLTDTRLPYSGLALGNRILSIMSGLSRHGARATVLTCNVDKGYSNSFILNGVGIVAAKSQTCSRMLNKILFIFGGCRFIYQKRKALDAVLIGGVSMPEEVVFCLFCRIVRVAFVRELCELPFSLITEKYKRFWYAPYRIFETVILPRLFDGAIVMTKTIEKYYKHRFAASVKYAIVPMTVEPERFSLCVKRPDENSIVYCGSMGINKDGEEDLIKAFSLIADEYDGLVLKLIGKVNANSQKRIQTLIKDCGVEKRVEMLGLLPRDEIPAVLQSATILALTRPNNLQAAGGFPTKLGEYLCSARPIVVTRVGEIPDYLTDNVSVFFAEPGDVKGIAKRFRDILSDYGKAEEIGRMGREVALENFDGEKNSRKVLELVEQVSKKNRQYR